MTLNKSKRRIDPNTYYTIQEARQLDELFGSRHLMWFYKQIRLGRIQTKNANPFGERKRHLIKGSELIKFLKKVYK